MEEMTNGRATITLVFSEITELRREITELFEGLRRDLINNYVSRDACIARHSEIRAIAGRVDDLEASCLELSKKLYIGVGIAIAISAATPFILWTITHVVAE